MAGILFAALGCAHPARSIVGKWRVVGTGSVLIVDEFKSDHTFTSEIGGTHHVSGTWKLDGTTLTAMSTSDWGTVDGRRYDKPRETLSGQLEVSPNGRVMVVHTRGETRPVAFRRIP